MCITGKHYSVQNDSGCLSDGLFPKAKDMLFFSTQRGKDLLPDNINNLGSIKLCLKAIYFSG